ncbi:glycosyl hydrolase 108 family protein [Hoeflea halophila]|uniref:glycosyl hydrolase 108 family protein n=1 Tax=Hoeflea halophila TaxID=714899 RepID=UPI0015CEC054
MTWVGPWGSIHQYGLAVDFVLKINGKWSWDDRGPEAAYWTRMHELALENGMTPLYNKAGALIEKPHIQLKGVSARDLYKGHYPEGGDEAWAEYLGNLIDNWTGSPAAPVKPQNVAERPPLAPDVIAEMEDLVRGDTPGPEDKASTDPRFQKLHEFIKRWEGGFVDHPDDPGGATNMGITIGTLAEWRGTKVTVEDVRELSRSEADSIFRANYYSANRCGEMPERMAMVVYNCSVLSGRERAIEFVQQAFNNLGLLVDGKPLVVDGVLGRMTMSAIRGADPSILAEAFMDRQEDYLRQLDTFPVFGKGWLNRMAALREFVNTLQKGAGARPAIKMSVTDKQSDLELLIEKLIPGQDSGSREAMIRLLTETVRSDAGAKTPRSAVGTLLGLLTGAARERMGADTPVYDAATTISKGPDGKPPLTPINAALGETFGRAMNGKKSVTGIAGLLLTAFLPKLGVSGDIVNFVGQNSEALLTLFSLITGWGMFGKLDKAIRLMGMIDAVRKS